MSANKYHPLNYARYYRNYQKYAPRPVNCYRGEGEARHAVYDMTFKGNLLPAGINRHTGLPHTNARENARRARQIANLDSRALPG